MTATTTSPSTAGRSLPGWLTRIDPMLIALVALVVFFEVSTGSFMQWSNLSAIASEVATLAIVAVPMAVLVIAGYLDLSVGSVFALGAMVAGRLAVNEQSLIVCVLGALAAGAVVGLINGVLCTYLGLSAFIVTLGTLTAVRGTVQQLSPFPLSGFGESFSRLGGTSILGLDLPIWLAIICIVAGTIFLTQTPAGRHVYAIGVSRDAAYLSGVNVRLLPLLAFVMTSVAAALAGAIKASVLDSVQTGTSGTGFELTVLTAVLLGGVAFTGGSGSIGGVVIGVLFLGALQNGLTVMGVPVFLQVVAQGVALVLAAGLGLLRRGR